MPIMEVESFHIGKKRYVRRYTKCGKPNCWCSGSASVQEKGRPGHGPYWHVELFRRGRTVRRYIGKELRIDEGDKDKKRE